MRQAQGDGQGGAADPGPDLKQGSCLAVYAGLGRCRVAPDVLRILKGGGTGWPKHA